MPEIFWTVRTVEDLHPSLISPYADQFMFELEPEEGTASGSIRAEGRLEGVGSWPQGLPGQAPILTFPLDGAVANGRLFQWDFQTLNADTQAEFAFRVQVSEEQPEPSGQPEAITKDGSAVSDGHSFSPDGSMMATAHGSGPYTVFDTSNWEPMSGWPELAGTAGTAVAFSRDGTKLAVGLFSSPYLSVIDVASKEVIPASEGFGVVWGEAATTLSWSPDDSLLVVGEGDIFTARIAAIVDTETWEPVHVVEQPEGSGATGSSRRSWWTRDGSLLLVTCNVNSSGTERFAYRVLNTSTWEPITGLPDPVNNSLRGGVIHPEGLWVALTHVNSSNNDRLFIVDLLEKTGTYLQLSSNNMIAPTLCPYGERLAVGNGNEIRIYDTSDWSIARSMDDAVYPWSGASSMSDLAYSPDSRFLAASTGTVTYVFDAVRYDSSTYWWNGSEWSPQEEWIESSDEELALPQGAWDPLL